MRNRPHAIKQMKKQSPLPHQELTAALQPDGLPLLEWIESPAPLADEAIALQNEVFRRQEKARDAAEWLLYLGFSEPGVSLSSSLAFWREFAGDFVRRLRLTPDLSSLRDKAEVPADPEALAAHLLQAPLMDGADYLTVDALESLWNRMAEAFRRGIARHEGSVESYFQSFRPDLHVAGRVYFHLVENKSGDAPFAFLATYTTPLDAEGRSRHLPLKHALQTFGKASRELFDLLATVHRAAAASQLVARMLENGEIFHPLAIAAAEAHTFLREVPLYESAGVLCRIPNWWKARGAGASIRVGIGEKPPSRVGMEAILSFDARLYINGAQITEAEARQMLAETEGLAFIKGKWVAADPEKLKRVLEAYELAGKLARRGELTFREALRMQLNPSAFLGLDAEADAVQIDSGQWLASVIERLEHPERIETAAPETGLKAALRPYQERGINWLWMLHTLNFGACLADDMGLGKTIQTLGFLGALRAATPKAERKASLLVIPASLIGNWTAEIDRFAPHLAYYVAHPGANPKGNLNTDDPAAIDRHDLIITTYALAQRYRWIGAHAWRYAILDEAQAIKNPGAKQSRAVKKLNSDNRIIMTGTPVENRLTDLWSLFEFLNPGLLGGAREFGKFVKEAEQDPSGYARLRRVIRPYVLRRLKTDKRVIADLPDKVEMKTFATLSRKQVALYQNLVKELERLLTDADGIQRKGLVLASLMKFKQICNHPDQYLGIDGFAEPQSGKFERLREICETIREKREKALIFTQFKEMTEPLSTFLATIFGRQGRVLHGGVPVGKRKALIAEFQNGAGYVPFMVLSLKAGGVGLNLTAANHVIHFDRWWNPAVEDQATDRAFRIGQKRNVVVHKFVTKGTVEEKIDQMLVDKADLSRQVVAAAGEGWITEMKNDELVDLFSLSL